MKKRKVSCEQIMAQGRKQNRKDSECPSQKPASEKPCNTRACHDMDAGSLPIITSQNTTYNQTDMNAKVDLKIGGIAKIFQGTSSIKIRCPVRKFDKYVSNLTHGFSRNVSSKMEIFSERRLRGPKIIKN